MARPGISEKTMFGGLVYVAAVGIEDDDGLEYWIRRGADFAGSLPPK
jgi:hypothetical protein